MGGPQSQAMHSLQGVCERPHPTLFFPAPSVFSLSLSPHPLPSPRRPHRLYIFANGFIRDPHSHANPCLLGLAVVNFSLAVCLLGCLPVPNLVSYFLQPFGLLRIPTTTTTTTSPPMFRLTPNAILHTFAVATEGRALVIAANKSDITGVSPGEYAKGVIDQVEALMPDVRAPPVLSVCALDGKQHRTYDWACDSDMADGVMMRPMHASCMHAYMCACMCVCVCDFDVLLCSCVCSCVYVFADTFVCLEQGMHYTCTHARDFVALFVHACERVCRVFHRPFILFRARTERG